MTTINPISIPRTSFNFSNALAKLGNKAVCLISSTKATATAALSSLKSSSFHILSAALVALKAFASNIYNYLFVGFTKIIATAEIISTSIIATAGPYYPVIAISIIAFGFGAGYMFAAQDKN